MVIPFNDLALKTKKWKDQLINATQTVIDSGKFLSGEQNHILEKKLQSYLNQQFVTTVASGHDALLLSLQALNLNKNDEIIFPVNSYPTAFPVMLSKCIPVPCDVDENGQLDFNQLTKKITKYTKVIIVVHLYGLVGNLEEIKNFTAKNNIYLIEDCAQAFGTSFRKKPVGIFGDIACYSFYPTKNVATLGDGGAVSTKHKSVYDFIGKAKSYGETVRYKSLFPSGHSHLPEIQAAFINFFLKNINNYFKQRKLIYQNYQYKINNQGLNKFIRVLKSNKNSDPVAHLFVIEAKNRNHLQTHLKARGINTQIHYPWPVHLIPAFYGLGYKKGDFPVAERLSKHILSLPFHSYLTENEINFIVKSLKEFYIAEK